MPVHFAQGGTAVNQVAAIFLGVNVLAAVCQVSGKFTDNFLEQVFQCDDTHDVAVFIHHKRHALAIGLEVHQLRVQRCAFRNEVGLVNFFEQHVQGDFIITDKLAQAAHVQHAFDIVDIAFVDRQAGMLAGADLTEDVADIVFNIQADDLVLGDHDVIDGHFFQVQYIEQHALTLTGDGVSGFMHNGSQLFRAEVLIISRLNSQAHGTNQHVRNAVGHPHQWI